MLDETEFAPAGDLPGVMDALYRFGAGVDRNDKALLATAFTDDAVVDFGPCGRAMGLEFPVLTGGGSIVGFLSANATTQTTSHVITNGRARVDQQYRRPSAPSSTRRIFRKATTPAAAR